MDSGKVLCYAAKWFGEKGMAFAKHTDEHFLHLIWAMLDEADAVVTFNGRKHDIPMLNREFIKAKMPPPSPFQHIDLIETAKKHFKFPSNKLDWLLKELRLGQKKVHEGFPMWVKVLQDDARAWRTMEAYNKQDVDRTERLYRRFRPWISSHPNHGVYGAVDSCVCPNCGSHKVQRRGFHRTKTQIYQRYRCSKCGHWSRSRFTEVDRNARKFVLTDAT